VRSNRWGGDGASASAGGGAAAAVAQRRWRLRVNVVRVGTQTDQTGDLIFLRLGLMHAGSGPGLSGTQASAVRLHDRDRHRFRNAGRQFAAAIQGRLFVALPCQVRAHLLGQTLHMAAADRHVGGDFQSHADQVERLQVTGQGEDASLEVGSVAMAVQT
jgi:hypothetical protein